MADSVQPIPGVTPAQLSAQPPLSVPPKGVVLAPPQPLVPPKPQTTQPLPSSGVVAQTPPIQQKVLIQSTTSVQQSLPPSMQGSLPKPAESSPPLRVAQVPQAQPQQLRPQQPLLQIKPIAQLAPTPVKPVVMGQPQGNTLASSVPSMPPISPTSPALPRPAVSPMPVMPPLTQKPQPMPIPTPTSGVGQSPPKPPQKEQPLMKPANASDIKQSPFRFLPLVVGILAILGIVWFIVSKLFGGGTPAQTATKTTGTQKAQEQQVKQTTLTYWGLWEPSPVMDQALKDFQSQNQGVVVEYVQQSPKEYRERLQDALKKGQGPDVFRFHATWAPVLKNSLAVMPSSVMTAIDYEKTFYPVVSKQLKTTDGYIGIPLMYDGLGLYYNTSIFQTANLTPPTQWADVENAAKALTVRSKDKKIERAGIALGTTTNVDNFSDILALLIVQNGGDPAKPSSKLVVESVKYYTNFYKALRVWDETLPNSTYAFATEKVAMMIAPSWRAFEVKAINPNIQFKIAPIPQLQGTSVAWATYWAEGVSKSSKQQDLAWKLLKYMSSKEVLQKLHDSAVTKSPRLFGEIYPRTDMASLLVNDPYAGAYLSDAPKATSWFMSSRTFDNGINDKIIKYYEDAVNGANTSQTSLDELLKTTELGVQQVLQTAQQ